MEHREFLEMLGAVERLSHGQSEKLVRAISGRGDLDEVHALIEERFERDKKCPHCSEKHLQRWGNAAGLRRFKCKSCHKTFNALTGTPLARLRKREQWLEFAASLLESSSIRKAAKRCKIAKDTSLHWRHRFLESQKNNQDHILKGVVEIDETFF